MSFYFPPELYKYDYSSFEYIEKLINELKIENNRIHCIFYLLNGREERIFIENEITFI